jgi:hypothetical protein
MSIGDIIDESFDLYKRNFALFAGVVAVLQVPAQIGLAAAISIFRPSIPSSTGGSELDVALVMAATAALWLAGLILFGVVVAVESGALTAAISERYLGRHVTLAAAYRHVAPQIGRLVIAWILLGIVLFAVASVVVFSLAIVCAIVAAALLAGSGGADDSLFNMILGAACALAFGVCALAVYAWGGAFLPQIVIVEKRGHMSAITRNWRLVRGRLTHTIGVVLLMLLVTVGSGLVLLESMQMAVEYLVRPWVHIPSPVESAIWSVWIGLIILFLQPLWMTCLTLLYYDQRVRHEGFDLAVLEAQTLQAGHTGAQA